MSRPRAVRNTTGKSTAAKARAVTNKPAAAPKPDATTTTDPIDEPAPETTPEPEATTPESATTPEVEPEEPALNLETEPASEPPHADNELAIRMASIVKATVEPGLNYFAIPGIPGSYVSTYAKETYVEIAIPHDKAAAVLQLLAQ